MAGTKVRIHSTAPAFLMDMEVAFGSGMDGMAGSGSVFSMGSGFRFVTGMGWITPGTLDTRKDFPVPLAHSVWSVLSCSERFRSSLVSNESRNA
ncbi:hypothetical protein ROHU_022693 [Labeo rohita]|uniref:Uncharacterized protein n=1 Tax=Labeo rohita TaxID=84645 RepID=A0A498MW21_LABRO|nr:hypothetical protein ROHU_022693 [Labeo rohita]